MNPLSVLQDYTIRGDMDKVKLVGEVYHFGDDYKFPKSVETTCKSKQGGFYTLDTLVFFVQNIHIKHTDYMDVARNAKLQFATFTNRKPLQDYLEGRVVSNKAIELLPPAVAVPAAKSELAEGKRVLHKEELGAAGMDEADIHGAKKLRLQTMEGHEVMEKQVNDDRVINLIREHEFPVKDRNSIFLCPNKRFEGVLAALLSRMDNDKKKPDVNVRKDSRKKSAHDGPMLVPHPAKNQYMGTTEEKIIWKEHVGTDVAEEFGIDPSQLYIADAKKKDGSSKTKLDQKPGQRPPHHPHHLHNSYHPHHSYQRPSTGKGKPSGCLPAI